MGGNKPTNLQDSYLNHLRKEKVSVVVYLTNGVRLKGTVKAFDNFVIILKEAKQQLIYKHAISSIVPDEDINFRHDESDDT
ncbi:Host factor Hfq [Candidatus Magnetoovum chiemensis]|nr:Host factor Hfq [Candidatus Magnetoovum chiemensis]